MTDIAFNVRTGMLTVPRPEVHIDEIMAEIVNLELKGFIKRYRDYEKYPSCQAPRAGPDTYAVDRAAMCSD